MNRLKFSFILVAAAALLTTACATHQVTRHQRIAPMESGLRMGALNDCTVAANFSVQDFNWQKRTLTFSVYSEDLYDAVAVSRMNLGDTVVYEGKPMAVKKIKRDNNGVSVNGDIDEDGAWLTPNGGGTYRATTWDDHSLYTLVGKTTLPLADKFALIDCGDEPTAPSDTIRTGQQEYIAQAAKQGRDNFDAINTRVTIVQGKVTEIRRFWIP